MIALIEFERMSWLDLAELVSKIGNLHKKNVKKVEKKANSRHYKMDHGILIGVKAVISSD